MEIKIGNQELPPLPFTYERTLDETKATDREWRVSPEKFNILQKHDARQPKPEVYTVRVPKDQIKLPEIKREIVYYFIKEPQA